jgi:hypothetical protein
VSAEKIICATILGLYVGRQRLGWLQRLPNRWHVAETIAATKEAGSLQD